MRFSHKMLVFSFFLVSFSFIFLVPLVFAGPRPVIKEFTAEPSSILAGESSLLSWTTAKADTCELSPGKLPVPCSGSMIVQPGETTDYNLMVYNSTAITDLTVTVAVTQTNHPPVANDDSGTTDEDMPATFGLLANDTDADGDTLRIDSISQPANGTVVDNGDGTITYIPKEDFNGKDLCSYTIIDGNGGTDTAAVTIEVNPVNDPPEALDSSAITGINTPVDIVFEASDRDDEPLTYSIVEHPLNGTISGDDGDNTITYTPTPDFSGYETITFKAHDGAADSNIASISVAVGINVPPVADSQHITIPENTAVAITLTGSDPNHDPMTFTLLSEPANGMLSGVPPDLSYLPSQDFYGTDSFSFVVNDSLLTSNLATVSITVTRANHPPVANNDLARTIGSPPIVTGNVLANDTDGDNDILTIVSFTQPGNGMVVDNGDNTFTYTPNYLYSGLDSFDYTIIDGNGGTATAQVLVTVHNPPPAVTMSSSPARIINGETAVLTWSSTYGVSATIDNGIGEVLVTGAMAVSPQTDTTYTLEVEGYGGAASASVNVSVWSGKGQPSPTVSISASPESVIINKPVTLSWTSDKAVSVEIDHGIGAVSSEGSWDVYPDTTTTYTITAVDRKGNTATDSITVDVTPLDIEMYAPTEGEVITREDVLVRGMFANALDYETAVKVDGKCALMDGDEFAVNHVPLIEGDNTVTVTAMDTMGNIKGESLTVSSFPGEFITLTAENERGTAPFVTTLNLQGTFAFASVPAISYNGPGSVDIQAGADKNNYDILISTPGLYYLTADAVNNLGERHADTTALLVMDQYDLDSQFRAKWDGMKEKLADRNVDGALEFFLDSSKEMYRSMFTLLYDELPLVVNGMQNIEMVYIKGNRARYRINNVQDVDGTPVTIAYDIYFTRDSDCIWKIKQF